MGKCGEYSYTSKSNLGTVFIETTKAYVKASR